MELREMQATVGPALVLSQFQTLSFIFLHVVKSFSAFCSLLILNKATEQIFAIIYSRYTAKLLFSLCILKHPCNESVIYFCSYCSFMLQLLVQFCFVAYL